MNQIIVKRPANISSQEALTELVLEYPESEVLSFRRVKSAGMDGEYFVATLRVAEHDEHVGDEEHDRDEDAKLDKIIRLIEQLIEKDKAVHKEVEQKPLIEERPPVKNPVPLQPMAKCDCWDGYCRVPGTKPCEEGSCEKCDAARKKSMVVVERNADVSKTKAKLELLKEFGKGYKIARLAKTGSIYSATLIKRSDNSVFTWEDSPWADEGYEGSPKPEYRSDDMIVWADVYKDEEYWVWIIKAEPRDRERMGDYSPGDTIVEVGQENTAENAIKAVENYWANSVSGGNRLAHKKATPTKRAAEGEIPIMSMRPARNPLTLEHRHRKQMPIKDPNDCDCCDADDPDCDCRDCHNDKTASLDSAALVKRADLREEQEAEMYEIWDNQAKLDRKKDDKSECDCCEDDGMCECDCHDGGERYMNDRWD